MKIIAETPRLLLREMILEDAAALFEMDSNPNVLKYIGTPLAKNVEESAALVKRVQREYEKYGVGRVAVVLKSTQETIGWAGLKHVVAPIYPKVDTYYDLGYRFIERSWGNGYGTEAAQATFDYAFDDLKLKQVHACAEIEHVVSIKILKKIGMHIKDEFDYQGKRLYWLEASR